MERLCGEQQRIPPDSSIIVPRSGTAIARPAGVDDNTPHFEDSDPEGLSAFQRNLAEHRARLVEAACSVAAVGGRGVLVPLTDSAAPTFAVIATRPELTQLLAMPDAMRVSIALGQNLQATQHRLFGPVRDALEAAGSAAGVLLPIAGTSPLLYLVAGDMASIAHLARQLAVA